MVFALLVWYVLEHSPLGRRMIATGAGADAARLAGTNTGRTQVVGLVISGFMGSLAGLMLLSGLIPQTIFVTALAILLFRGLLRPEVEAYLNEA
jgi:ribose transport system permease protein